MRVVTGQLQSFSSKAQEFFSFVKSFWRTGAVFLSPVCPCHCFSLLFVLKRVDLSVVRSFRVAPSSSQG